MGKPFQIKSEAAIGRGPAGQFQRLVTPKGPVQVIDESGEKGIPLPEVLRSVAVPDTEVGMGAPQNVAGPGAAAPAPVYPAALPWGPAGPVNDANKKPMKLR